jgi:hypothetical protein
MAIASNSCRRDTESNVDEATDRCSARHQRRRPRIVGNIDPDVCRRTGLQQRVLVVTVGAAPQITEQGSKYVARNFPMPEC